MVNLKGLKFTALSSGLIFSAFAVSLANIDAGIPPMAEKNTMIMSSGNNIDVNSCFGMRPEKIIEIANVTVNKSPTILEVTLRNQKYFPFHKIFHFVSK